MFKKKQLTVVKCQGKTSHLREISGTIAVEYRKIQKKETVDNREILGKINSIS